MDFRRNVLTKKKKNLPYWSIYNKIIFPNISNKSNNNVIMRDFEVKNMKNSADEGRK